MIIDGTCISSALGDTHLCVYIDRDLKNLQSNLKDLAQKGSSRKKVIHEGKKKYRAANSGKIKTKMPRELPIISEVPTHIKYTVSRSNF